MIGDAYFQLRAQVGTALFSLLRLASETGAGDGALPGLRSAQAGLRESLLFVALGPSGGGKSTLLNSLFDREFCGVAEPSAAGKTAVFQHGEEVRDETLSPSVMVCQRPHIFLRDFTIVDAAGLAPTSPALLDDLAPYLPHADVIFFVISAAGATADIWEFLLRMGRDALKRTIFVVWQSDRVSSDEGANAVKRIRQAMLKNLGHACPIFAATGKDRAGREKLTRWIENEVIFSGIRRTRLAEIDRLAHEALGEIAGKPHAVEQAWQRTEGQLRGLREDLAEREEQSQRQVAGALWTLAQSLDALRQHGETLLRQHLGLSGLFWGHGTWRAEFASGIETQAHEALTAQAEDAMGTLAADLREAADEHRQACRDVLPGDAPAPAFSRKEIAAAIQRLETPLGLERVLAAEAERASLLLRMPALAFLGALAVLLGTWPVVGWVPGCAMLVAGTASLALLLALLLRQSMVAAFGHHYTANRTALLKSMEAPLAEASAQFYAALARPLDARIAAHAAERQGHEPLLTRVEQLQQTFQKIAGDLRTERASGKDEAVS
jgi:hypothetical protein